MAQITLNSSGVASSGSLLLQTNGTTTQATLDTSGNLGLGVTPSAWATSGTIVKALQIGAAGSIAAGVSDPTTHVSQNGYFDGTNWRYIQTNVASNYYQNGGSHVWRTAGSGTAGNAITFTQAMTLDASGRLGIGATSLSANLQVENASAAAELWLQRTGYSAVKLYGSTLSDGNGFKINVNGSDRLAIDSSGNLGIGTTSPAAKLDISGSGNNIVSIRSSSNGEGTLYLGNAGTGVKGNIVSRDVLTFHTTTSATPVATDTERMRIDSSGNLLVGTTGLNGVWTTPLTLSKNSGTTRWAVGPWVGGENSFIVSTGATSGVYLNGTSATSWSSNSDETLKENLVPISNAAEKVCSLRAVTGNYIEDDEKTSHAFLIAQDVQAVLPEAVATTTRPDGKQVLGLAYTETIPLLVAAIKELKAEIDVLKGQA